MKVKFLDYQQIAIVDSYDELVELMRKTSPYAMNESNSDYMKGYPKRALWQEIKR